MSERWNQLNAELEELRKRLQTPEVAQRIGEIDAELDAMEWKEGVVYLAKRKAETGSKGLRE